MNKLKRIDYEGINFVKKEKKTNNKILKLIFNLEEGYLFSEK